ncbi:hypothetical protein DVH05_001626 [Phytophthora capsici]|nr:hypothetical protein DVH05_001626 [Phytophthora capsici]
MTSSPSSPSTTQTPRATAAITPPQHDPAAERVVIDVDAPYAAAPSDPMLGPAAPAASSSASPAPPPPPTDTPLASGVSTSSAPSPTASTVPPRASSRLAERKRTTTDLAEATAKAKTRPGQ